MNVIFMGTPAFAVPGLRSLLENGHTVSAVFTQPDKPQGRGLKLMPPPIKEYAQSMGIPVYQPRSLKKESETVTPLIKSLNPDCIAVIAYGMILPPEILKIPKHGCINVHGSLLPKYRGAAPIQWSILNGDEFSGVTTMLMAEGMDTGDMLLKRKVKIGETETSSELYERLSYIGAELLIKTLAELSSIVPEPQNDSDATLAPMLTKQMSPTDFNRDAASVRAHINGLCDWPGATAYLDGRRLKLLRAQEVNYSGGLKPGTVTDEKTLTVACKSGAIKILEIQPEGSRRMSAEDFLRGHQVKKGTVLSPDEKEE